MLRIAFVAPALSMRRRLGFWLYGALLGCASCLQGGPRGKAGPYQSRPYAVNLW